MTRSDTEECQRLVDDLRNILMKIDSERVRIVRAKAIDKTCINSQSSAMKSHGKINLDLNHTRNEVDIRVYSFMLRDRIKATVLTDKNTYDHCIRSIHMHQKDLRSLSNGTIKIIKYLKMQILGLASVGL